MIEVIWELGIKFKFIRFDVKVCVFLCFLLFNNGIIVNVNYEE